MRGTSSSAKMRLRSGGYKCTICGRRVVDAALLERHLKNMHNIPSKGRKVVFKAKPQPHSKEEMEKKFDDLIREKILEESKTKAKNKKRQESDSGEDPLALTAKDFKNDPVKQTVNVENDSETSKNAKRIYNKRRAEFECPVCGALFSVYYTAHKHIQRMHPINAVGEKVPINSPDLIQPIRVEQCLRCYTKMKSNEPHVCQNLDNPSLCRYLCSLCNQGFITLKSFDLHVVGLHCDGVESMFFPTEMELTSWRLEMERETNANYALVGSYDSKKVYRCTHTKQAPRPSNISRSICPSAIVIQDFAKGTQVHFYPEHSDYHAKMYPGTLSTKYVKYSISTFLKSPGDVNNKNLKKNSRDNDMYEEFKTLMEGIIVNAKKIDEARLKILVEKALDMTTVLNEEIKVAKPNKRMTDKEITDVLEEKPQKRRISTDCVNPSPPSAAKRTRNKSLFVSDDVISPKIISTYSLATDLKADSKETNTKPKSPSDCLTPENDRPKHMSTRSTRFNQSPSFNDTYKDFIDKTIKAATNIGLKVKKGGTKIDETVQNTSPSLPKVHNKVTDNITKTEATAKLESVKNLNDVTITVVEPPSKPMKTYKQSPKIRMERIESATPPNAKKLKTEPKESPVPEKLIAKKPLDFKYEVVEQENDCNILVLKI